MSIVKNPTVSVERYVPWSVALDAARRTVGKPELHREPSSEWKRRVLMAEHSPLKLVMYRIAFSDLRQWVGVHLLRHEHMVPMIHSQRADRRDLDSQVEDVMRIVSEDVKSEEGFNKRDYLFQGEANDQDFYVNAQTLINISRRRLCSAASPETRYAWRLVRDAVREIDPEVADVMVRQCVYRGRCPEMSCCGYCGTEAFRREVDEYWKTINR